MSTETSSFRVPAGHPCLPGHFPGRPIVPGVVLLQEVAVLLGRPISGWDNVKLLAPVLPDQDVCVTWRTTPGGLAVTATVDDRIVLSGIAIPSAAS